MNSLIVHLLQIVVPVIIWRKFIVYNDYYVIAPRTIDVLIMRFIASICMHLNVEKDVRQGLLMMRYANNHWGDFENVHIAFGISFLLTFISLAIEVTVILLLTTINDEVEVIMKYVPLSAMANLPRFYYNSLVDHKML